MKCQFCGSKLDTDGKCPVCGKTGAPTEHKEPQKTLNKTRLIVTIVAGVALIAAIVCILGFSLGWFGGSKAPANDGDQPQTGDTLDTEAGFGSTDVTAKAVYAVETAVSGDADMLREVARFDGGALTNGEFNIYFWMEYYNFINSYGAYAQYMGLDLEAPLHGQESLAKADETDENSVALTWEQYFMKQAVENYGYYKGLELAAAKAGYTLSEEQQKQLDDLPAMLEEQAANSGYETGDAFLQATFGTGVCSADYLSYMKTYLTAYGYYTDVLEPQCAPSDADVEAYFDENAATYLENNGLKKTDQKDVQVRHILIQPEFTIDSNGDGKNDEATDEAWAAAEAAANDVYAQWQEDPTEENFAALAKEHSADGNAASGGLYDDVYPGQMVETFNDWCFDPARQVGDHGIVKTPFGYHIMYFSAFNDNLHWFDKAAEDLTAELMQTLSNDTAAQFPVEFNFDNVVLCDVVSAHNPVSED